MHLYREHIVIFFSPRWGLTYIIQAGLELTYVGQAGLKFSDPATSAFPVTGISGLGFHTSSGSSYISDTFT